MNNLTYLIKNELTELGIKPKKSLGQNFLINEGAYKKIVSALELRQGDVVVEIGPGLGTLTEYLATSGAKIIAVEKDRALADHLKIKFANQKNVTIVEDDILKFNPKPYTLNPIPYKIVGNIPYYLTSYLLRTIFEKWLALSEVRGPQPGLIVLMLQKEVAQRICAKPPRMSLLAVSVQYFSEPKIITYVSKSNFWPSPTVDSAIIKLVSSFQLLASSKNSTKNYKLETGNFFKIVRAGFTGKRKQLGNNLARGLKLSKSEAEEKLRSANVNPARRAETLTLKEWRELANIFSPRD